MDLRFPQARDLLLRLKAASAMTFIPDHDDVSHLPTWVKAAKQTIAGYLTQLAKAKGAILATLGSGFQARSRFRVPNQK